MKKLIKKWWKAYLNSMYEMYSEAWKNGITPYHF